jgi:hypothetical protein
MPVTLRRRAANEQTVEFSREGDPALWPQKGHWRAIKTEAGARKAVICCPRCANLMGLRAGYEIDEEGAVSPAISCRCGVMGTAQLSGWVPG